MASVGPGVMLSELALVTMVETRKFKHAVASEETERHPRDKVTLPRLLEEYTTMARLVEARIRKSLGT